MAVEKRMDGDVAILEFSGPMTIGTGDVVVRESVAEELRAGTRKMLLDFAGVTNLDSSGVGELISAYTSVTNRGGSLKLARLSPKVDSVLQVTRLTGILESYPSQEEALIAFATSS